MTTRHPGPGTRLVPQWRPDVEGPLGLETGVSWHELQAAVDVARGHLALDSPADAYAAIVQQLGGSTTTVRTIDSADPPPMRLVLASAHCLAGLCMAANGSDDEAGQRFERAVELFESVDETLPRPGVQWADYGVALTALHRHDAAIGALKSALELGDRSIDTLCRLAELELDRDDAVAAVALLDEACGLAPENARPAELLGRLQERLGDREAAAAAFVRAGQAAASAGRLEEAVALFARAAEHPTAAAGDAELGLGEALRLLGRPDEALEHLRRAVDLREPSPWASGTLGQVLRDLGRYEDAIAALRRTLELDPSLEWAAVDLADVLVEAGRVDDARRALEQALRRTPDSVWIHVTLANVVFSAGGEEEALCLLEQARAIDPTDTRPLSMQAEIHGAAGRLEAALEAEDRVLESEPEFAWGHAKRGEFLHGLGRFGEATAALEHALGLDSRPPWTAGLLSRVHVDHRRFEAALRLADQGLASEPDDPRALVAKAEALYRTGATTQARKLLTRAQRLDPEDERASLLTAEILVREGEIDAARTLVDELGQPLSPTARMHQARVLGLLGRREDALDIVRDVIDRTGPQGWMLHAQADVLRQLGRYAEALKTARRLTRLEPRDPTNWWLKGELLRLMNEHLRALEALEQAVDLDPDYAEARVSRGRVLLRIGRYEDAADDLRRASELDPEEATTWRVLGEALRELGLDDKALAAADRSLELRPGDRGALRLRGDLLSRMDRLPEAQELLDRALAQRPDDAEALLAQSRVLARTGQPERALELVDLAIQLKPEDPDAHEYELKGRLLADLERPKEAEEQLRMALDLDPDAALVWRTLGGLLRSLGRTSEAERALSRAIELAPQDVTANRLLGYVEADLGLFELAERQFRRCLELRPDDAWVLADVAYVQKAIGRHEAGLRTVRQALSHDPRNPWALTTLASILCDAGRFEEVLEALDALDGQPDVPRADWTALHLRGWAIQHIEPIDAVAALEAYDGSLASNPGRNLFTLRGRADVLCLIDGREPEARVQYQAILDATGGMLRPDPDTVAVRGWAYYGLGQYERATRLLLNVIASANASRSAEIGYQFDLGLVLCCDGALLAADRELSRALDAAEELDPELRRGVLRAARIDLVCASRRPLPDATLAALNDVTERLAEAIARTAASHAGADSSARIQDGAA